ncbi:MAG: chromate transporter, partial [Candidatus Azotimanducaceae bacterium]
TFWIWAKIGFLSFGGPAAQIALMHRMVVAQKGWLNEKQYLNALGFCMLLPGPEAMQLATYAGWKIQGTLGGLMAGLLFILPGAIIVLGLAISYVMFGDLALTVALFLGIKAAVLIIVIEALFRVAKRALYLTEHWFIAAFAFICLFLLEVPYPLVIALSAGYGFLRGEKSDGVMGLTADVLVEDTLQNDQQLKELLPGTLFTVLCWLLIWWVPLVAIDYFFDIPILTQIGAFFSKLAVVTFGGAYAVLAYLAQDVVNQFGWLTAGEMMDGLGLAETTPGPLILVTEFVGFIAGYRNGGLMIGLSAALITLWVTFVPCFMWIFAGAPYLEWIGRQPRLKSALAAITAAVVGVILNLSLWFSLQVLFKTVETQTYGPVTILVPIFNSIDWRVLLMSGICAVLILRFHWSILPVLATSAALGVILAMGI